MTPPKKPKVDDILKKYERQLEAEASSFDSVQQGTEDYSREFTQFKQDMMPNFSKYENRCKTLGRIIKLKLAAKDKDRLNKVLTTAHLDVTPNEVVGLALVSAFLTFIFGLLISVAIFAFRSEFPVGFLVLVLVVAGFLFYYFYTKPGRFATQWKLKAGSQMIPCILYTVVYMKHTSNLERAIQFASQHLEPPLSVDFKKIFWDVETGKFSSIKASLDNYLESWKGEASEFVESFNLIESSLYEPSEDRRVQILERSLEVILDGVYDKMLKYTHSVKSPLTNLYMFGVTLPILGLALLPLASVLLKGAIKWYHVLILFNILIPFFVFYKISELMSKRPGGYGESSILEKHPLYYQYKSRKPYWKAFFITFPLLLIGLLPFIFQFTPIPEWLGLQKDYVLGELGIGGGLAQMKMFDFIQVGESFAGPMGVIAVLLSLFIPLAIFLFFSIAYKEKSKEIIKARDQSRILEKEFNNSLFQLGNRIGDGMPAELAFGRVAESSRGQVTADFFKIVNSNIRSLGMGLEKAIFDPKRGAIIFYPSQLIATSMHILIESVKKGLQVAAQSLMSISEYVKNVNKINDRLKDLLADVVADMKSTMSFLAPLLAGIVVGLGAMIVLILSKLTDLVGGVAGGPEQAGVVGTITTFFEIELMISPFWLQVLIGVFVIEIVFILTKALVTVDAGDDQLKVTYDTSKALISAGFLYIIVALMSILLLAVLAAISLSGISVG